jgi:Fe-S-cluster containining protein
MFLNFGMQNNKMKFGCDNCDHCAVCCKGWDIDLSTEDIRTLAGLGYDPKDFLDFEPVLKVKTVGREKNCIFLDKENMCVIEKKHGHAAKPHTCKQYPKMKPEALKEKDYFFYEYGGKTFSRDLLVKMLEKLKASHSKHLFEALLHELEKLSRHKVRYIDLFNYDEAKNPSGFGKMMARRRVDEMISLKFSEDDIEEFRKIGKSEMLDVGKMIEELQNGIPGSEALNPNLPEMLLAYFHLLHNEEPRDAKAIAAYFFRWNAKRF